MLFQDIDVNRDGRLDKVEIQNAFKRLGIRIEDEEANRLIKKIKKDGSVSISFEEWRDYLILHPAEEITELMNFWRHSVRTTIHRAYVLLFSSQPRYYLLRPCHPIQLRLHSLLSLPPVCAHSLKLTTLTQLDFY